jgi:hypothetical protein
MHTTEVVLDGQTFQCHHNGDFSGDVLIAADETSHQWHPDRPSEVKVPFQIMRALVAESIRDVLIGRLEDASVTDLLERRKV